MGESFFWYRPTRVVPDKRPLNGCVCVCVCVVGHMTKQMKHGRDCRRTDIENAARGRSPSVTF